MRVNVNENELYYGYCIDLLNRIAKECNFTYDIKTVDDGYHGSLQMDGKWNGIVGELIDYVGLNVKFYYNGLYYYCF